MKNKKWMYWLPYLLVLLTVISLMNLNTTSKAKSLSYDEFMTVLETKDVQSATVSVDYTVIDIRGEYVDGTTTYVYSTRIPNTEAINNALMEKLQAKVKAGNLNIVNPNAKSIWMTLISNVLPILMLAALAMLMISRMNAANGNAKAFEFSKSRARLEGNIKVRFNDVAGCDEEKEEMAELIDYLKNPKKFIKMGARIPKGILMVGPPGTGKTLLAKAVAGEADVPFYSISGSDFVEMFVGVGASRVRDMFKKAQSTSPCMIFIDEIDAVGRQRGAGVGGGHDEREQTLNQLLVEMDGIEENTGIVIIAATNRPDVLDPALLRPGRFDRQITVNLPDKRGRMAILDVHARNKKFTSDVNMEALAQRTPGFSGADLANVLNEAAIMAVRNNHEMINMDDLDEAIDRVMAGPAKKSRKYSESEKKLVAIHEAGHAVIGLFVEDANIVQKVTIIPRGMAGGYNLMTPKEERIIATKRELYAKITSYLGGRVAEEVCLGEISTGASNDIQEATRIAKDMVMSYGMSNLGPIQYETKSSSVFLGRDYAAAKDYSAQVAIEIDNEVRKIIDACYAEAKEVITSHRDVLENIANALVEHETLTKEDLEHIMEYGVKPQREEVLKTVDELSDLSDEVGQVEPKEEQPTEE
ncbi:MAG: ATP-dependent metallopeptidase FtsH/Yme1/Tma family protein [Erysipelotrichaceae bacterium]|nr:ATP-dependent metallopeptidase FtsH/Yme1/Tma family protein [Erysipelotrichaceae bacterium]